MSRRSPLTKKDLLTGDNRIRRFSSLSKRDQDKYRKVKEHTGNSVGVWSDETLKQVELTESLGEELDFGMPEVMGVKFSEAIEETGSVRENARIEFAQRIPLRYYSPWFQLGDHSIYWPYWTKEHVLKAKGPEDILLKYDRFCELRDFIKNDHADARMVFGEYISDNIDRIRGHISSTQHSNRVDDLDEILKSSENACGMLLIDDLMSSRHADAILNSTAERLKFALDYVSSNEFYIHEGRESTVVDLLGYTDPSLPDLGEHRNVIFNEVQGSVFNLICASHLNSTNRIYCNYNNVATAIYSIVNISSYNEAWILSQVVDMLQEYINVLDSQSVMIALQCVKTPDIWISCSSQEETVAFMKKYHDQGKLHLFINLLRYIVMEYDNVLPNTSRYLEIEDRAMILDPCLIMGMIGSSKPRIVGDRLASLRKKMKEITLR